jgi:AcrR family transcriptional regulator
MKSQQLAAGRPRVSSRDTIEDAAAELFLEQSYAGTTIEEITRRAGVSRATFFNYFASKGDLLWIDADHAIERLGECLDDGVPLAGALALVASEVGSERVPLAVTESDVMGTREELVASGLARVARVAGLIRSALVVPPDADRSLAVDVRAHAITGAVVAAWGAWIRGGIGRRPLAAYLEDALALVELEQ